jgi:hypothetical protein
VQEACNNALALNDLLVAQSARESALERGTA